MYFDTHTHLNAEQLKDNRHSHLKEFIEVGGVGLVNIGANIERSTDAIHIAQQAKKMLADDFFISATIGIHPSETCSHYDGETTTLPTLTPETLDDTMDQLKKLYRDHTNEICAIGECGIDLHYPGSTEVIQLQQELLARQCQFALDTGLPLVIHSRNGFPETIEILNTFFGKERQHTQKLPPIVFHCFGYGPDEAQYILTHFENAYLGFDGNITYKSAQPLRDAFLITPMDKVLLETDAPYLAPIPLRGEINTPKNIVHIYSFLADLKKTPHQEFTTHIYQNACRFFGINSPNRLPQSE